MDMHTTLKDLQAAQPGSPAMAAIVLSAPCSGPDGAASTACKAWMFAASEPAALECLDAIAAGLGSDWTRGVGSGWAVAWAKRPGAEAPMAAAEALAALEIDAEALSNASALGAHLAGCAERVVEGQDAPLRSMLPWFAPVDLAPDHAA